ncbi:MAG: hypothetical protein EAY81_06485 [Bacteroidetes bacterium]|nr:MAG: hypothetical protein EAY81_06485 [Bacteroidota bacterium]
MDNTAIIHSLEIKGYKSIKHAKVNLQPGLNILIGRNSSGKSILFEGIQEVNRLLRSRNAVSKFSEAKIEYLTSLNKLITVSVARRAGGGGKIPIDKEEDFYDQDNGTNLTLKIEGENVPLEEIKSSLYLFLLKRQVGRIPNVLSVKFNLPSDLAFLENPGSLEFSKNEDHDVYLNYNIIGGSYMLWNILFELEQAIESGDVRLEKQEIQKKLKISKNLKDKLKKFSPIADLRFSPNLNIYKDKQHLRITNIYVEFKIGKEWVPWNYLSDGTKRLFYLIHEVVEGGATCILIEEPELGIHPHQFHKILEFLKEEAHSRQIVISTHSPQSLNILEQDELDRIIISKNDSVKGSVYVHLTKNEIKKAQKYTKEVGFLSDYWLHSDLEK